MRGFAGGLTGKEYPQLGMQGIVPVARRRRRKWKEACASRV